MKDRRRPIYPADPRCFCSCLLRIGYWKPTKLFTPLTMCQRQLEILPVADNLFAPISA
jgi:hypothetical protein